MRERKRDTQRERVCTWVRFINKLINKISYLALLTIYLWGSILSTIPFSLGGVLALFRFHCNPHYVTCAHKTMMCFYYSWSLIFTPKLNKWSYLAIVFGRNRLFWHHKVASLMDFKNQKQTSKQTRFKKKSTLFNESRKYNINNFDLFFLSSRPIGQDNSKLQKQISKLLILDVFYEAAIAIKISNLLTCLCSLDLSCSIL